MRDLCEDLLMGDQCTGSLLASFDEEAMRSLMDEVSSPTLRGTVLSLAEAAARADQHYAEAEAALLDAAYRYWSRSPALYSPTADTP